MEVDSVLTRLREATAEINRASDDAGIKLTLEKTWLLQDRLAFPDRKLDAFSKKQIRSFGHVRLCGVLHVSWQTKDSVQGQYMICLLYRDVLCLASAGRIEPIYTILACINLNEIGIEEADNGRGLQCHSAPFSWKLVFESDHQLHEIILTACSPREEREWRSRLSRRTKEAHEMRDPDVFSSIYLDIKSLGPVFRKPGTAARRMAIQRATTVGPKSPLCQVVLKNTSVSRDPSSHASASLSINRSQSLLTTTPRVPVLAPARSERARLEALMADVWSREVLPFPGMTAKSRSENLVRTSASSVIRKLSVASIASSLTKRSGHQNQRSVSSDFLGSTDSSKRCDVGAGPSKPVRDKLDEEQDRRAKRQKTALSAREGGLDETQIFGSARTAETYLHRVQEASRNGHVQGQASRSFSTLLPRRSSSPRRPDAASARELKKPVPRVKKSYLWRANAQRSESSSGFRKIFMLGRNG